MRTIACWIPALPLGAFALACGTSTADPHEPGIGAEDPPAARASVVLTLELTQTSQNPTPTGLPTAFRVSADDLEPGGRTIGSWSAENGAREPREGTAEIRLGADGASVVIVLFREGGAASDAKVLKLEGMLEGAKLTGSFSDALYYPRAGLFEAARR